MINTLIGLESSSIMPLVAITPLTQECYENIWGNHLTDTLIAHEDSVSELQAIFKFRANTFYSNPITRLEKVKDFPLSGRMSLKGMALKLLLDGQRGGWIGNKNSRVQTFFFSDVIDAVDPQITDPKMFAAELVGRMQAKIRRYNDLLTPRNGTLTIDLAQILPYWGFHNVTPSLFSETRKIHIQILPNCECLSMFDVVPFATRRDAYHYHMLKKEKVHLILVGDANYRKNICSCTSCASYDCDIQILTDRRRKEILNLT